MNEAKLQRALSALKHQRLVPDVVVPLVALDEDPMPSPSSMSERINQSTKAWEAIKGELEIALLEGSSLYRSVLEPVIIALSNEFNASSGAACNQELAQKILARARELVFAIEELADDIY
jgi:hypothetical protein